MRPITCNRTLRPSVVAFLGILVFAFFAVGCGESMIADPSANGDAEASAESAMTNRARNGGVVKNFVAPLSGDQEVTPVETNATGLAKFKLNKAGDALSFKLNVANIEDVIGAHIHRGAPGMNGPVVACLTDPCFFPGDPVTVNGTLAEGTVMASDVTGPLAGNFDALIEAMRSGNTYVNVHTIANPSGEIRGQIVRGNGVTP